MRDIMAFRQQAAWYLRQKGVQDDDVLSEMVCVALERADQPTKVEYAYLRAVDRLNPRVTIGGRRQRGQHVTQPALDDWDVRWRAPETPAEQRVAAQIAQLHPYGLLRAMLLLRLIYGWPAHEIGALVGVGEGRITQLLGRGQAAVLAGQTPQEDREFLTTLEVQWIRW